MLFFLITFIILLNIKQRYNHYWLISQDTYFCLVHVRNLVSSLVKRSLVVFLPVIINIGPLFHKILTSDF